MARGDSLARQLKLIELLDRKRQIRVREAARELTSSVRTVYRDLQVLERVGIPIYQEQDGQLGRWRLVDGFKRRLSLTLSWSEMLGLAAGRELLAGYRGTIIHDGAASALEKIREALPEPLARRAKALMKHVSGTTGVVHDYSRRSRMVTTAIEAIDDRRTVSMSYRKPCTRAFEQRTVNLYHLHAHAGALYLVGWCHDRRALRTFLFDRVGELNTNGEQFVRDPAFSVDGLFHGSFGAWSTKSVRIQLRFSKDAAPWAGERIIHPSQNSQLRDDGSLDMSLMAPLSPALVSYVVGWGPRVKVVSPKKLREMVRQEHREAVDSSE